jgi:glycosyltransferase involved in cell wall biosynthesis
MAETVGVVIGTYGDMETWRPLAMRAWKSAAAQKPRPKDVTWQHDYTLQRARNGGAEMLDTDWLIFLDADDELAPGYVKAMLAGEGDIRRPSTYGIYEDGTEEGSPSMIPKRDLDVSNYIVIGAMVRRELFLAHGGFRDYDHLEDWDLWRRLTRAGATVGDVPDAVYRIHVRPMSRNFPTEEMEACYRRIRAS